ncbi:hypothetical protein [Fibrobacter intestinalis]|uniref:hypothetical protein n=1 Tax=Fibrobacter intestinalis TaxID=28122 RepID=UPI0023EFAE42|nr:hypothetical protein [Fibrobacter intestinalis]MDD7299182.1 hypothetical protein [Fibrobacter intestinalis]
MQGYFNYGIGDSKFQGCAAVAILAAEKDCFTLWVRNDGKSRFATPANLDKLGEFQPAHLGKKFSPKHLWRFCLIKKNIGKLLGQFVGKRKTARKSSAGSWANGNGYKMCRWTIFVNPLFLKGSVRPLYCSTPSHCDG